MAELNPFEFHISVCVSGGQERGEKKPTNGKTLKPEPRYFGTRILAVR
ncbi:MAG: hypothetical protein HN736_08800 [Anaerolineae bacterium]|nr:hypothetical protein [Anaerolineae bacterium]MBT4311374.1 hypothetical protein [Anaerolineae bacterium]MBT4459090.1 hypothetical protein [Anaerolineae bacterium]MBT6063049.1 hypothetical protein [Anaerolineae bacterium]MBT6322722.1 hypothetical protein [Anaerolineae bacterium]